MLIQKADCIEIISENADLTNVNIYNASGKLITSRHGIATDKVVFPVGIFSLGVYFVKSGDFGKSFFVKR